MAATRLACCASCTRSHAHFAAVMLATGTVPMRRAQICAPSALVSSSACRAARTSFYSIAGTTGSPRESRVTRPCCWAATEIAPTSPAIPVAASAAARASHQFLGSLSLAPPAPATTCGAEPLASTAPSSASTTSTFVDWVELSTPATSLLLTDGMLRDSAAARARAVEFLDGRKGRAAAGRQIAAHRLRVAEHPHDVPAGQAGQFGLGPAAPSQFGEQARVARHVRQALGLGERAVVVAADADVCGTRDLADMINVVGHIGDGHGRRLVACRPTAQEGSCPRMVAQVDADLLGLCLRVPRPGGAAR